MVVVVVVVAAVVIVVVVVVLVFAVVVVGGAAVYIWVDGTFLQKISTYLSQFVQNDYNIHQGQ